MSTATVSNSIKDFVILGPTLAPNNGVLEAIHALYYLPENYKIVFTGSAPVDQSFYKEVITLVEHDELSDRVHFTSDSSFSQVAIVDGAAKRPAKDSLFGDSPEALASAILHFARAQTA
jgi:hypothetical protein